MKHFYSRNLHQKFPLCHVDMSEASEPVAADVHVASFSRWFKQLSAMINVENHLKRGTLTQNQGTALSD